MASKKFFDPVMPESEILRLAFHRAPRAWSSAARPSSQPPSPTEQASSSSQKHKHIYTVQLHVTDTRRNITLSSHEATFSDLQPANGAAANLAQKEWYFDEDEATDIHRVWHGENGTVRIFRASIAHDQQLSCFVTVCEIDRDCEDDGKEDEKARIDTELEADDADQEEMRMYEMI
ncbi:MAG: hypothetical protein Q9196_006940 [Gyalolechia fulgens]